MAAGQQLLNAHVQLIEVGYRLSGYHWVIHSGDYAALKAALGVGGSFLGIRFNVTEDPELLGAGPVLMGDET